MNPTVSLVIPVFNQAEFLEDCIESVYTQNFHEIIIVNDGSTDGSREIAERYMFKESPGIESPVRVINQVNKGLASARNTGIMNATGEYVWFLDSDDMLKEEALDKIISAINQYHCDVLIPSFEEFGLRERQVVLAGFNLDELKQANRLGYFSPVKRSVLLEVGGFNPRMRWGWEDWDIWFDIFKRGKTFVVLQDILVRYRVRENSMLVESNKHSEELLGQIKRNHPTIWQ